MLFIDQIRDLFRQLMPTGRAFKGPVGGYLDDLNNALSISERVAYSNAISTFDSAIPDNINGNFTTQDAADWERRLGLTQYNPTPAPGYIPTLQTRLQAIQQQYNYPGNTLPRGFWKYVQDQLQAAGFNVWVYENRFFIGGQWVTKNPVDIIGGGITSNELADHELGDAQLGGGYDNLIANSIDPAVDASFNTGSNLRSTFFIGGATLGTWAYIPLAQQQQFRQLVLRLKPTQTVAFLFVIYTP